MLGRACINGAKSDLLDSARAKGAQRHPISCKKSKARDVISLAPGLLLNSGHAGAGMHEGVINDRCLIIGMGYGSTVLRDAGDQSAGYDTCGPATANFATIANLSGGSRLMMKVSGQTINNLARLQSSRNVAMGILLTKRYQGAHYGLRGMVFWLVNWRKRWNISFSGLIN